MALFQNRIIGIIIRIKWTIFTSTLFVISFSWSYERVTQMSKRSICKLYIIDHSKQLIAATLYSTMFVSWQNHLVSRTWQ